MQAQLEHLYEHLRHLVYDDRRRNELAAREYMLGCLRCLNDRADILCQGYVESIVDFKSEDPGRYGPCDLVVVAEVVESTEERRRRAYVWEVKSPQNALFERETKNRVRPSADLIKAENQLFHYHEDRAGSESFRNEFGILSPDDVVLGGVIIGRNDTILKIKGDGPLQEGKRLYETALRLRRRYIYRKNNMELMTWSNVLRRLQPARPPDGMIGGACSPESEVIQAAEHETRCLAGRHERKAGSVSKQSFLDLAAPHFGGSGLPLGLLGWLRVP
jgi:hypothetical protein